MKPCRNNNRHLCVGNCIFLILCFTHFNLLGLLCSTGLLCALLPLFGFAPFDSVDSEFDAGWCVLGGSIGDGGGWHLFITTLGCATLSSYKKRANKQVLINRLLWDENCSLWSELWYLRHFLFFSCVGLLLLSFCPVPCDTKATKQIRQKKLKGAMS